MNKISINQSIQKNYQLLDEKKFGLAEQNAHNLLKYDPNNSEIFNLIGDIHYKQNNFDKSVWYYFSSIDRNFDIETLNRLSVNISLLKNNKAAKKILTDLLDYQPDYIPGYLNLGLVYEQNQEIEEAINCYEAVIELNPHEIKGYLNLANIYKQDLNYAEAIKVYQKAIIKNPNNHYI